MILVLDPDAPEAAVAALGRELEAGGWRWELSRGQEQAVISVWGDGDAEALRRTAAARPEVEAIPLLSGREYQRLRQRRRVLSGLTGGLGLLVALGVVLPVLGFLSPPDEPLGDPRLVAAGEVSDLEEGSARRIRFRGEPVLLARLQGERFFALSATCTYMDVCRLEWSRELRQLVCACHGCAFDVYGNVLRGPAPVPLRRYAVERRDGRLFVHLEG